jgi:hypothetical protein
MRRVFAAGLLFGLALFPIGLEAQRGGGARVGGGGVHAGSVGGRSAPVAGPVGPSAFRNPGTFARPTAPVARPGLPAGRPGVGAGRFVRPGVVAPYYPGYYSPYYSSVYPYYGYGGPSYDSAYAPAYSTYGDPGYAAPAYTAPEPAPSDTSGELAYQMGQLSAQIAELRAEQSRTAPAVQSTPHTATMTVLVFRDGHRQEIQNYAIVGQTLWTFDEHNSARIALSDLDLTATQNENRLRGVRFAAPER